VLDLCESDASASRVIYGYIRYDLLFELKTCHYDRVLKQIFHLHSSDNSDWKRADNALLMHVDGALRTSSASLDNDTDLVTVNNFARQLVIEFPRQ